ncbi:hypothetical protein [Azoarcus sp. DN11]|uniref:hypothetical protein n=1 Tax=Azoarcus sp. DN11 TaxID=356837 RepID=UPI000FE25B4C|nr:hypothetical protein [Azoarcus sp. DN11]
MLHIAFRQLAAAVAGLLLSGAASAAITCSKAGFDELNRDRTNTAYFLDDAAEKACLDKPFVASGSVKQVYGKDEFELIAEDGLGVTVLLAGSHGCGDLLQMKKGQRVKVGGTVARTYRSAGTIRLRNAVCQ